MSEIVESLVRKNMAIGEVICRAGKSEDEESAPTGDIENHDATRIRRDLTGDIEQFERKKKTRRRKTKRKNPYMKNGESRGKKIIKARVSVKQPVAPYNSNQFLIEDHNDLQDFDVKLMAVSAANKQNENDKPETQVHGRTRDASFTSAESDQDYFYSSPEDEEEFLTKEFSNTYQDLHVESLASMSKTDLIQTVLQLEEKIDSLEKELGHKTGVEVTDVCKNQEQEKYFEKEISKLVHVNEELQHENEKLRQQTSKLKTESSEDSESDSSSSSDSSDSEEDQRTAYLNMNGDVHSDHELNMDSDNVT